jgi:hypothetical protein
MTGNVINAREEPSRTIRRKITLGNPQRGCMDEKAQCQSTVWCGLSLCTTNPFYELDSNRQTLTEDVACRFFRQHCGLSRWCRFPGRANYGFGK